MRIMRLRVLSGLAKGTLALMAACTLATSAAAQVAPPASKPSDGTAEKAIAEAIGSAKRTKRHVLLNFGADWCAECRVLEKTFADPVVSKFLNANFVVVRVPIGKMVGQDYAEMNLELVKSTAFSQREETPASPALSSWMATVRCSRARTRANGVSTWLYDLTTCSRT
jgi:hypothetical protein